MSRAVPPLRVAPVCPHCGAVGAVDCREVTIERQPVRLLLGELDGDEYATLCNYADAGETASHWEYACGACEGTADEEAIIAATREHGAAVAAVTGRAHPRHGALRTVSRLVEDSTTSTRAAGARPQRSDRRDGGPPRTRTTTASRPPRAFPFSCDRRR